MESILKMLSKIKVGYKLRNSYVVIDNSKNCIKILKVLLHYGFILGFYKYNSMSHKLVIFLKYIDNKPLMRDFKFISSPSRSISVRSRRSYLKLRSSNIILITTSKGFSLGLYNNIKAGFLNNIQVGGIVFTKIEV